MENEKVATAIWCSTHAHAAKHKHNNREKSK